MNKTQLVTRLTTVLVITGLLTAASCQQKSNINVAEALSYYNINGSTFHGTSINDKTYKVLGTDCKDNNIFRLYYSDSVLTLGFPAKMKIMSIAHAGHLGYNECYLEVSTSATDTWLSTGADSAQVIMMDAQSSFIVQGTQMQHYTSTPLNDFGVLKSATVVIRQ